MKRTYPFLKDCEVIDMDDQDKTYEDTWTPNTFYTDETISRKPKIAIIGNAINTDRFKNLDITKKIPHSFIWMSSPDRGLEEVLNMWGLIRKVLPDATLRIFYGWEYFDTSLFIPAQREFKERIRELLNQDGVEWCGRVGQEQIALELAKTQCLLYPPHSFRETYGIAFLEAQAAGVINFYRMNGALGETIGTRGIPLSLESTPEQIVSKMVETLGDKEKCDKIISSGREYALQRSWDKQVGKVVELYG
jgi:glycosyltransferase involved in cell wall biosynthesis